MRCREEEEYERGKPKSPGWKWDEGRKRNMREESLKAQEGSGMKGGRGI